jgi:hypothetical protein
MRFHQSWYRANILRVPCGVGPKRMSKTYYGNMLREADGERGVNFLTPQIFDGVRRRLAIRRGAIDEFRLLCNLLSSQSMCFNLFAPLVEDLRLAKDLIRALLPEEIGRVRKVWLEFVPEPARDYLNDRTSFDVYIYYTRPDGERAFIGIETKLSESFTQKVYANPRYLEWTRQEDSPWPQESWSSLLEPQFNPLWRNHLLAIALKNASPLGFSAGRLMLVYHPGDVHMQETLAAYRALLKPEDDTFLAISLDQLVKRWRDAVERPADREWLADFSLRYLELEASEAEFEKQD